MPGASSVSLSATLRDDPYFEAWQAARRQVDGVRIIGGALPVPTKARYLPGLADDRTALKLNGKDDRLRRRDSLELARIGGLPDAEAEISMAGLAARLARRAGTVGMPEYAREWQARHTMRESVIGIAAERSTALTETLSGRKNPRLEP